jgi:hypothetical protein
MSRPIRHSDTTPGWINRQFRAIDGRFKRLESAKRLPGSTFPPGIIPTSALKSPSAPGYVNLSTDGFGVDLAGGYLIDETVSVPSLFSSCVIALTGRVYAFNSTASDDYLLARAEVAGVTGTALPIYAAANPGPADAPVNVCPISTVLTELAAGDTFPVRIFAATGAADWASDVDNLAELTGAIVWFG